MTFFCGLPLFHVNGVTVTGLVPFSRGAHVLLGTPQGYRGEGVIENFWKITERHKINFFSGMPTVYSALLQVPIAGRRIDSLEYGLCGAAPMPAEVFRHFQEQTGVKILEGYGLTEAACVSSVNPPLGERRLSSIGLRIPGQAIKVVLVDGNSCYVRQASNGEIGELVISGPNVFNGYLLEEQNQGLWLNLGDGQRWLRSGDLGYQDAQGYFWLTGRTKELIIRGGHNLDPAAIEQPLHEHAAVLLVAAIGRPDPYAGEVPVAYVQFKPGQKVQEQELLDFLKMRIGEQAAMPKNIVDVEQMPLTAVGKIYKPELKRLEIQATLTRQLAQAGISVKALQASGHDGKQGIFVEVDLADAKDQAETIAVLDRFPFKYRIHVDEN